MLTRIITGVVALIIFVPVLFFSDYIVFDITMAVISALGLFELLKCCGMAKKYVLSVPALLLAFAVPLFYRYTDEKLITFLVIIFLFYLFCTTVFTHKKYNFNDISIVFFSTSYVTMSFTSILILRSLQFGEYLYLLVFIGAWVTDTFAYFTGKLLGKHKLIPDISPKKTVEGAIGGILFCSAAFVLYGTIILKVINTNANPHYLPLAITGAVISVFAQIGDFSASAIKRYYNSKDFGSIFPGHGGVLDRFDSVMLVAPILMIIASILVKIKNVGLFG